MSIDKITLFCFGASYAVALMLELAQLFWPRPVQRLLAAVFAGAGLLAHTLFLAVQRPSVRDPYGSLLFLAWILAVFYLYGSIHHRRLAWGVFVLPVLLGIIILAALSGRPSDTGSQGWDPFPLDGEAFWRILHVTFFILSAVGVCVAFMASVMYLVQARRLKVKVPPGQGLRLLSLERLEDMNRRAITWAFPLLTAGLLIGTAQMWHEGARLREWTDPRILSTILLWLVFAIVLYLRYDYHLRGRRVALLTILAFALLLLTLLTQHSFSPGGGAP
jgi:ABC-type transport system involved in cytochrome c biogenesis permease subunit